MGLVGAQASTPTDIASALTGHHPRRTEGTP
jgi:hypothetical protein